MGSVSNDGSADLRVHKQVCVCVCVPACWRLVYKRCSVGVRCMFACVTLGLVPPSSRRAFALVCLLTNGCPETNDLAPVTQRRRTRDEKKEEVTGGVVGKRVGAF